MKQMITVEQINELSEKQKEKLREWWKPTPNDLFSDGKKTFCVYNPYYEQLATRAQMLPLLSIGQMIELLENKKTQSETLDIHSPKGLVNQWSLWYANGDFPKKYEKLQLCDALWQAVKECLYHTTKQLN